MARLARYLWLVVLATLPALSSMGQSQACPVNIDFFNGTLLHWEAYTGNNKEGNGPTAIKVIYDSGQAAPYGTIHSTAFPEYNLPGVAGISLVTRQGKDPFGGFQTIPVINGYTYRYSILLGSTSVAERTQDDSSNDPNNPQQGSPGYDPKGGYVRGIRYSLHVPAGPPTQPYTITYAYAMVLENGSHSSEDQPMARATLATSSGVIECASPSYYLATNGGLDSASAKANGFSPSPVATPNPSPNPRDSGVHLHDVWTKGWKEVTFDLSPYRGQQVSLTFEADNCVPGGHFAYAYFALREECAGLRISGDTLSCPNNTGLYSIPSLDSASYDWSAPDGWTVSPIGEGEMVSVKAGAQGGWIVARAKNSCTLLSDSLFVHLSAGGLPEFEIDPGDTTICYGQTARLHAVVTAGTAYQWLGPAFAEGESRGAIGVLPYSMDISAGSGRTADYILTVRNADCPILVSDTVTVAIVPPVQVNAGNDTLVVVDQPLHFHATTSDLYPTSFQWSPSTDLSNPAIADPIGLYSSAIGSISYQVTATDSFGCYGTGSVKVTIAPTLPDIFVPNAFTPGAGSNNLFRPVCIGISSLDYFRVYNRWGQLVYSTSQIGQGWDGRSQGKWQESNSYLWMLRGKDYTGRVISKKGTMMLIR